MTTAQRTVLMIAAALFVAVSVLFLFVPGWRNFWTSPTALRDWVRETGPLALLVIILYHGLQVLVAPVPGQALDIANGYVFGPVVGSLYSALGITLGTFASIFLAHRYGRLLVARLVGAERLRSLDERFGKKSLWFFLVLFLTPVTPHDFLCYAIGLTRFSYWPKALIATVGRMPTVLAAVILGSTGRQLNPLQFLLIAAAITLVFTLILRLATSRRARAPGA